MSTTAEYCSHTAILLLLSTARMCALPAKNKRFAIHESIRANVRNNGFGPEDMKVLTIPNVMATKLHKDPNSHRAAKAIEFDIFENKKMLPMNHNSPPKRLMLDIVIVRAPLDLIL